ncbi:MAG: hypothetical protein ABFS56_01340 [Pseudomonadota bacterium]
MKSKILITILLYLVINTPIFAFPSVDKTVGVHTLSNYAPYVLRDDKDENVFYLPFTRLAIARTESNKPDFSFVYLPSGLIIQLGVQVSIDQAGLQPLIEEIKAKNPNARFRYLPVDSGRFMPTLRNNMGVDSYAKSQTDFNIAHNNPRQKRQMSFFFTQSIADLIVLSIANGGGFAINYEYQYRASVTPSSARVEIHWGEIDQFIGTNTPTLVSPRGLNELVRQMSVNQSISIQLVGGHLGAILKRVTALIRESCFKAVSAGFEKRQNGCENKQAELFYQTAPIEEFTALAGFQLPGMCLSHPDHFRFMDKDGQFVKGCPDSIYGADGPSVLSKKPTIRRSEIPEPITPN